MIGTSQLLPQNLTVLYLTTRIIPMDSTVVILKMGRLVVGLCINTSKGSFLYVGSGTKYTEISGLGRVVSVTHMTLRYRLSIGLCCINGT